MDYAHFHGVRLVEYLQDVFSHYEESMLFLSHVGDPRNAYLIYFPLAYCLFSRSLGLRVLWTAAVADWLNASLKWLLFGHRPYWWVYQQGAVLNQETPFTLRQYRLTCETGPGSPSGHAMINTAVWFVMILGSLRASDSSPGKVNFRTKMATWALFTTVVFLVCLSRLFIATHFPHQVLLGVTIGILIGTAFDYLDIERCGALVYAAGSLLLIASSALLYTLLKSLNWDPGWSIDSAVKWCTNPEFIYLDTTPFYALSRDAGSLLFTAIFLGFTKNRTNPDSHLRKIVALFFCLALPQAIERLPLKNLVHNMTLFYTLALVKNGMIPVAVILIVYLFYEGKNKKL